MHKLDIRFTQRILFSRKKLINYLAKNHLLNLLQDIRDNDMNILSVCVDKYIQLIKVPSLS